MKRLIVHIDRLVLNGFRREERHAIAAGLQQELARVFANQEAAWGLRNMGDLGRLRVHGVQFEAGSNPQQISASVAQGIVKEIRK